MVIVIRTFLVFVYIALHVFPGFLYRCDVDFLDLEVREEFEMLSMKTL